MIRELTYMCGLQQFEEYKLKVRPLAIAPLLTTRFEEALTGTSVPCRS